MSGAPKPFERSKPFNDLPHLPPGRKLETERVLKALVSASRALAEFRAVGLVVPGSTGTLVRAISLQEAKDSSQIENIVTTNDRLYRALAARATPNDPMSKEVIGYLDAIWHGHKRVLAGRQLDRTLFCEIASMIKGGQVSLRSGVGTRVGNPLTGKVVYTPPEGAARIAALLDGLSRYYAVEDGVDPLVKMAAAHYQFEAIHPFQDGNGRTGRILNVLYLVKCGLLVDPVLFLSRAVVETKAEYYRRLLAVTERGEWEEWILYMLSVVERSSVLFGALLAKIPPAIALAKKKSKKSMHAGYSDELVNLVFQQPVTRISHLVQAGVAKRRTASLYLKELERAGVLTSEKHGRDVVYVNDSLLKILGG